MKTKSKALLLTLCAVLLVAASVLGTMAYLTDTDSVKNTFTVGKVDIKLDEAKVGTDGKALTGDSAERVKANSYKLMPGHVYDKDPTIHVAEGSEDCYIVAKVTLNNATAWQTIVTKYANGEVGNIVTGTDEKLWWVSKPETNAGDTMTITFVYKNDSKAVSLQRVWQSTDQKDGKALTDLVLFKEIVIPDGLTATDLNSIKDTTITVNAYAIQADGFVENSNDEAKAAAAWSSAMTALNNAMAPATTPTPAPAPAPETDA